MRSREQRRRGQALLLVTLALFAMCGLLGLAVDLGWGYFVKKSAQASADAGAMAAAYYVLAQVGQTGTVSPATYGFSGNNPCPDTGKAGLVVGCQYAQQSGFGGTISMTSGSGNPPTVSDVTAEYWVTTRAVQTIPQLFSAVLGNPTGISSARATAAIFPVIVNGSLITLNRSNDPTPTDVSLKGHGDLALPAGLYAADSASSSIDTNGATTITGPIFQVSGGGATKPGACGTGCTFTAEPDGTQFLDPMSGKGQPPLPASALNSYAVINGSLSGIIDQVDANGKIIGQLSGGGSNVTLPPGNYFAAQTVPCGKSCTPTNVTADTSNPVSTGGGTVTFSNSGSFGDYFFYGGLNIGGTVNMGPGQYVVVGGGLDDTGVIQDANSATDGGEMMIVTGTSTSTLTGTYPNITNNANNDLYPGLVTQVNSNAALAQFLNSSSGLFGQTTFFKSGDGTVDPSGVNTANGAPSNLQPFNGVVFWQDQANSTVLYNPDGTVNTTSCGAGHDINNPCTTSYQTNPNINFHAQGDASMSGIFYQPRGAGITSIGHGNSGDISGNLQVITGYFASNGGGGMNLTDPPIPLKRLIVALVE
jgi:Flp pilus assembly protein TadG